MENAGSGYNGNNNGHTPAADGTGLPPLQRWGSALIDPPGLAASVVRTICQSNDGALWFGTSGGASRFDPLSGHWQTYTQTDGLVSNLVRAIHQSRDGTLWFGTSGGVSRFDPASGHWQTFTLLDGLTSNIVYAIYQSDDGVLWFGTRNGVSRFDLSRNTWRTYFRQDGLAENLVRAIHGNSDGILWFGTSGGVSRFDPTAEVWQTFTTGHGLAEGVVLSICQDVQQALWFGTLGGGVSCLQPCSGEWRSFSTVDGLADDNVRAVLQSSDGAMWFATFDGVSRYQPASGHWQTFTRCDGLASNVVRALYQSRDQSLWFGTLDGVSAYQPGTGGWQTYSKTEGLATSDDIYAISQSRDGCFWFGTWGGGVSRFEPDTGHWLTYTHADGLCDDFIRAIHQTDDGTLWFGSLRGGVSRFDTGSGRWKCFSTRDGLADNHVTAIRQSHDGRLWFTTWGGGISCFDPFTDNWQTYTQSDGLADNVVRCLCQGSDGALWFGTSRGVSRFHPVSGEWHTFNTGNGLINDVVRGICQSDDGALWFATADGVSRFDPDSGHWQNFTWQDGLADNDTRGVQQSSDGALWFISAGSGVCRYDPLRGYWRVFTEKDGLADNDVRSICQSRDGALWFGTVGGISMVTTSACSDRRRAGAVSTIKRYAYVPTLSVKAGYCAQTRAAGLALLHPERATATPIVRENTVLALVCTADARVWSGECLAGLHLHSASGHTLDLNEAQGLPANHVITLMPLPGQQRRVWVGTAGGAARIALSEDRLQIERIATYDDGLPTGPVDALATLADGGVFLGYSGRNSRWIFSSELAQRRAISQVRYLPEPGEAEAPIYFYGDGKRFSKIDVRALVLSNDDKTLWAATSAGLFKTDQPYLLQARFQLLTRPGSPQTALRQLKANPLTDDLWMIADAQDDVPARVIGYNPGSDQALTLGPEHGLPWGLPVHDLDFTDTGELVVLAGSLLFKGLIQIGEPALVSELRAQPGRLRRMPLAQLAAALEQLQKAQALEDIRRRLGLSEKRLSLLLTLATDATLQALARLLGMEQAENADVRELSPGLWLLNARLDYPEPLKEAVIPLFNVDPEAITAEDTGQVRSIIRQQLENAGHRFDLPFLLACRDNDLGQRLIPDGYAALIIDEAVLRDLLFAQNPQQTFAGVLLTRGLLALSPYRTEGEVKNPAMFYGRDRLLREVIQTELPQFLLVGPRRIGKTSLLRRLVEQLANRRPELQLIHLDLLGIADSARVGRMLARHLKLPAPAVSTANPADNAARLADLLYDHFSSAGQPGVILIDEADNLIEADAAVGFPLLTELRNLQSAGLCSFVLTGYWYLFRRTLDHTSPVYNFALVKRLGPLEPAAARALASEPMVRLGLSYANEDLAEQIVLRTGGYPTLIQLLCDQLIEHLQQEHALVLTGEHLRKVERSQRVRDYLAGFFRFNTGPGTQLLTYRLLEQDSFSLAAAHISLEQTVACRVPLGIIESILLQLVLYGLVTEADDHYRWSIPLVRDTLLAGKDREHRITRLLQELPEDTTRWITPSL